MSGLKPFWLELSDLDLDRGSVFYSEALFQGSYATDINGGFGEGNFPININPYQVVALSRKAVNKNVIVYSPLGDVVYEGRVEAVGSQRFGITLNTLGYYAHSRDITAGLLYPSTTPVSISDIVIDVVDLSSSWTINYGFITRTTTQVNIIDMDFTGEAKLIDVLEKVLSIGSDDAVPKKMYFQIWKNRLPYLIVEPDLQVYTYYLDLTEAKRSGSYPDAAINMGTVFNKIQVLYDDPTSGGQNFTSWYEDAESQKAYGIREGTINLGESEAGTAQDVAEMALDRHKNPEQTLSISVPLTLCTKNYQDFPGYAVRGGDVVLLTGETSDLFYEDYQPGRAAGIVTHSSVDIAGRTVTLNFGTRSPYFEMALALLGYSSVGVT